MSHLNTLLFLLLVFWNNAEHLSQNDIENLLLQQEKFWVGTLVTQHKGGHD